jgi:aminocarboxymuconate-semialdehyde decarboxylase
MRIDVFNHFMPPAYLEALQRKAPAHPLVRLSAGLRPLWDMEERLRVLAQCPDLQQVVTLGQPTPELVAGPERSPALARLANDGMAAIRDRWPQKFPQFVASLPMNNIPAALEEMDRAIIQLGACGIQVLTSINGRPLDDPELFPVFERITLRYGLPVWMHPYKPGNIPDYPGEAQSEYEIWVVLGWPHESSVAMARIVFSEMFDRLPGLRVLTHHCGATIPYLLGRVGPMWDELGVRTESRRDQEIRARMAARGRRPIDYFRDFHTDTVVGGSVAALRCGLDFFGAGHVLFATDFPYGPGSGMLFMRENMRAVEEVDVTAAEREMIFSANALDLVRARTLR